MRREGGEGIGAHFRAIPSCNPATACPKSQPLPHREEQRPPGIAPGWSAVNISPLIRTSFYNRWALGKRNGPDVLHAPDLHASSTLACM